VRSYRTTLPARIATISPPSRRKAGASLPRVNGRPRDGSK